MTTKSQVVLSGGGVFAALFACWAILVALNYVWDPLHLKRFANARDGMRLWTQAPVTLDAVWTVLPGHLRAVGSVAAAVGLSWLAGARPAVWFNAGRGAVSAWAGPLRLGLGMGFGSLALFGAGLVGLFTPGLLYIGAGGLAAVGWRVGRRRGGEVGREGGQLTSSAAAHPPLTPGWVVSLAVALAAVSAAVNLLGALAPETGYDSLIQHLADPRNYLAAHKIYFNDLSFLAQHPAGIQMLYALLLPAGGDAAAKILHAVFAGMISWAFWHYARSFFGSRNATLLACMLYLTPFTGILSARAYIDHGLTFYGAVALLAPWGSWLQGAFIGLAIGAKYLGGFLLIGWVTALAVTGFRPGAWRVAGAASLVAGWWGIRNWLNTGNPVYPFGYAILGGLGWDATSAHEYGGELSIYGQVKGVMEHLAIPWLATVRDRGALDDGSLGPLYLMLAPLLLFLIKGMRRGGEHRTLLVLTAVLWGLWLASPRQVRYALQLLPPTLAVLAYGMWRAQNVWPSLWRFVIAGALLPAALFVQFLISFAALYLWVNPLYVVSGLIPPMSYLTRIMEPRDPKTGRSMYMDLVHRLPEVLPANARTYMLGDAKVYYLPGRWVVNALFNPRLLARLIRQSETPDGVARRLRQRGVTHVLYNVGGSIRIEYTHHLFHWNDREFALLELFARGWLKPKARYDSSDGEPAYLLYELAPGRYPDPPYLPGLDTRLAHVESLVIEGKLAQAREVAAKLRQEFPSSRWLPERFKEAWKLSGN